MSTDDFTVGAAIAVQATLIALIKDLRARDPNAVQALLDAAEREAKQMTPDGHPLQKATLSSLRNVLFLED